ncbi:MAG: UDP-N-acetylmuramoyl-L-alanyl-D-glutamate--2,6-diaminopimelate ligase [Thermoanaerobaculia bacterium]
MELLRDLPATAHATSLEVDVEGITHDSRRVQPGDLFVALVGERFDGRVFVAQAVERGAVAVLAQGAAPSGFEGCWIEAREPRSLLAPLAARLYGHADRELLMIGVTGTNGKSTVIELVASMLEASGRPCGRLGTLGYRFGGRSLEAARTTPEASDLHRMLREARQAGAEAVAMEVSSHALAQGRVAAVGYDVAVFTNLTRDHFDFHGDFESYFAAKARLFDQLVDGGRAVVNVDDSYGRRLAGAMPGAVTYGAEGTVRPLEVALDRHGLRGRLATPRGPLPVEAPLLGRFNLENVMAAVAVGEALDLDHPAMVTALARSRSLPGRMESVERGQAFLALVDYAHTDAALEAALRSTRELLEPSARLIVVFGCGGDRDAGKRVLMGRVAGQLADRAVATSDNPRSEAPSVILAAVEEGLRQAGLGTGEYDLIEDRRSAIRHAVESARPGDAVLVAGKGHEQVQIVDGREIPFSDQEELARAIEEGLGGGHGR